MIPTATVDLTPSTALDTDELASLLTEAAGWHRIAQASIASGDHDAARYAYRMRELLARHIATRSTLGFHEARSRAIIRARSLQ